MTINDENPDSGRYLNNHFLYYVLLYLNQEGVPDNSDNDFQLSAFHYTSNLHIAREEISLFIM